MKKLLIIFLIGMASCDLNPVIPTGSEPLIINYVANNYVADVQKGKFRYEVFSSATYDIRYVYSDSLFNVGDTVYLTFTKK